MSTSKPNLLAIDYGSRKVGLAISIVGVISPLATIKNDPQLIDNISKIINQHKIAKVYVGISYGPFAQKTKKFINQLKCKFSLPIETVEETASTIEAESFFSRSRKSRHKLSARIDSVSAAVILRRVQI